MRETMMNGYFRAPKSNSISAVPSEIWAVGGGKGGIGKSFISSSLAISMARAGKSVTIVDLDLGSANLHTCLGAKIPALGLSDFVTGRIPELRAALAETDIPNLTFISGFNDAFNIADLGPDGRARLIHALSTLPARYVILDLGAGTSETTLDFFLAADQQIVATTPEPTAVENAYRFMKSSFYRRLRLAEDELGIRDMIDAAMDSRNELGIRSPADLVQRITMQNPEAGALLTERISGFRPQIILNQTRSRADIELGHSMKSVCRKYFGVDAAFLGHIDHDNAVWQSLRKRRPIMIEHPYSSIVGQVMVIAKNLMNPQSMRAVV